MSTDPKLARLTAIARAKIGATLDDMAGAGWEPVIAEGLRTVAQQREKVRRGFSKTMKSDHLTGNAADIVERGKGWNSPREFWLTLGRCALLHGLDWGGLWIGSALNLGDRRMRKALQEFLMDTGTEFKPENWQGKIGWDPAHIAWKGK